MRLSFPVAEKVQQGAIFNCVRVQGYEGCRCHGIVLTARCDLEHEKQSVVNFLPVVLFRDWAQREMPYPIAKRHLKECTNNLQGELKKRGVTEVRLKTFPWGEIISREIQEKDQKPLLERLEQIELAKKVIAANRAFCPHAAPLLKYAPKACSDHIRDLISQKLGEYYFLEHIELTPHSNDGYVVLLRRMQTINSPVMNSIAKGIFSTDIDPNSFDPHITFDHEQMCLFTSVLRSPDIEHLTQTFSHLYVRIGLEDQEESTFSHHMALAASL